jgi:F0F1-type ATP synthase membrane subunit b/b'
MEWMIPVAAALASLLTTAGVVFRRSRAKALQGGEYKVADSVVEADRIRTQATLRRLADERALPQLEAEFESAERGESATRIAHDLLERKKAADEEARRSTQSFNAHIERYEAGLDRLREAGVLIDTPDGPMLDVSRIRPEAREAAARVADKLQQLEWFKVSGLENGFSGPLKVSAFTQEDVESITERASRPDRIDKERIRADEYRARGLVDPRADSPRSLAEALNQKDRKGLPVRISVLGARRTKEQSPRRSQ